MFARVSIIGLPKQCHDCPVPEARIVHIPTLTWFMGGTSSERGVHWKAR